MKQLMSLDGEWKITGTGPDQERMELNGKVPGQVHTSLYEAGIIPDYFWEKQAEDCQWAEDWIWEYSRTFTIPETVDVTALELIFEGLDTYAEIWINGRLIRKTDNMFMTYKLAGDCLSADSNEIMVRFMPCRLMTADKPHQRYNTVFGQTERLYIRRMSCTFYWDWVNRFVTAGIWRPVRIVKKQRIQLENLYVYTRDLAATSASLNLSFDISGQTQRQDQMNVEIVDPAGQCVWREASQVWNQTVKLQADLASPELWWPAGYGGQPIYTCKVSYYNEQQELVEQAETTFGIRTVRIEQLTDQPGSEEETQTGILRSYCKDDQSAPLPGKSFTLLINGQRIFCKGGNWVPADPFPSEITDAKYDQLIRLARDGNYNLLRSWGGGIYEPDSFFAACDRYGIMVSQDFNLACGEYPEDDAKFVNQIYEEVQCVVPQLRNHPSLVWWCQDNENSMGNDFDDPQRNGRILYNEVFDKLMPVLDPSRPFRLTSPYGGRQNNAPSIGDCHRSWWLDYCANNRLVPDYKEYINITPRFASESTLSGMPPLPSLRKFLSEDKIAANDRELMEYRTKNNPHLPEGCGTLYELLEHGTQRCLGASRDGIEKARKEGYVQYEWTRLTMEAARRSKWFTSGLQYWMYNDCWPGIGWSMVDYYGTPKAAYYAMKHAAEPVTVSIKGDQRSYDLEYYVLNDTLQAVSGQMDIYLVRTKGDAELIYTQNFRCAPNENLIVTSTDQEIWRLPDNETVIVCEIHGEFGIRRAFYHRGEPADMDFGEASLDCEIREHEIVLTAAGYARVVTIETDIWVSDNYFDMLPGERKVVEFADTEGRTIDKNCIYCWNESRSHAGRQ